MKNSTEDLQDELDSYDVENSLRGVAACANLKDLNSYNDIINRKHNISTIASAKLISNTISELQSFVAFTNVMSRPTHVGEMLRTTYIESLESLNLLRDILITMYEDDEGFEDVNIVKSNDKKEISE
jgi:hypothetical protein|tara:strand:- start:251 stop:631 length:381 start_codon:yes stop_codon:yes gene_type:complete